MATRPTSSAPRRGKFPWWCWRRGLSNASVNTAGNIAMEFVPSLPAYPPTLTNVIADAAERHAGREFLVDGDRRFTFRDAERASAELARGLLALGVGKAARVAIVLPDCADWVLAWWA